MNMNNKERINPFIAREQNGSSPQPQPSAPIYPAQQALSQPQDYSQQFSYAPRPWISAVKHKHSESTQLNSKESSIQADLARNCMYILSQKKGVRTGGTYDYDSLYSSPDVNTSDNRRSSAEVDKICDGTIDVESIDNIVLSDGSTVISEELHLVFTDATHNRKTVSVGSDILDDNKAFGELLSKNGIIMCPGKQASSLIPFVRWRMNFTKQNKIFDGYFYDENGLRINGDEKTFRNALDPIMLPSVLEIEGKDELSGSFYTITCCGICIISRIIEPLRDNYPDLPKVVIFIGADCVKAENELLSMFCNDMNPVIFPEKEFRSKLHKNNISLIKLSDKTDHISNRIIHQAINYTGSDSYSENERPCDTIMVMVVQDEKYLKDFSSSEQILVVPYGQTNCGSNAFRIANLFQASYLRVPSLLDELITRAKKYQEELTEDYDCDDNLAGFYSLLVAVVEKLLVWARIDQDKIRETLEQYCEYLVNIGEKADDSVIEILRKFIIGDGRNMLIRKEDLPSDCAKKQIIGYTECDLYIAPPVFRELAESNGMKKTLFAQHLKDADILLCGEKYQRNVAFPSGQARFYDISLDKLFELGQIRLEPNDFADDPPALMIQLGECDGKTVYFSMSDRKGTDNGHIYITGQSGSGKSYFLKKFARNAAEQGIEVVVIGTEDTCPDFDDCAVFEFSSENLGNMTGSFNSFISPILQSVSMSHEAKALAEMLGTERGELHSVSECIVRLRSFFENEPAAEELIENINKADCYGIYSDSVYWDNVCRKGRISVVKSDNDDKTFLDSAIRSFYDFKCSQSEISPCLLVLDECQAFDLEQGSALIDLILRRGRKRGIMAVLTSQYLTAADGRNITRAIDQCDTYIAFKPGNSPDVAKRVGINVKDSKSRSTMASIGKYNCIARGRLSTDRCMIDYPLIIRIPK